MFGKNRRLIVSFAVDDKRELHKQKKRKEYELKMKQEKQLREAAFDGELEEVESLLKVRPARKPSFV